MFANWFKRGKPEDTGSGHPHHSPPNLAGTGLTDGERIYAIGDIHGRLELLEQLQAMIGAEIERDRPAVCRLVYVGDYIDRGGKSREVIERLIHPPAFLPRAVLLRGNHEQTLLDCLDNHARLSEWLGFGGLETMMSYGVDPALLRNRSATGAIMDAFEKAAAAHLDFFDSLPCSAEFGPYFFCHAGVRPGVRLDRQSPQDLMWIRQEFLDSPADFGRIIIHGHTPAPAPDVRHNRINIDTGAYATRKLTAIVLEGEGFRFLST